MGRKSAKRHLAEGTRSDRGGARRSRFYLAIAGVVVVVAAVVSGAWLFAVHTGGRQEPSHRAAIVDQLSARIPNASFVDSATSMLEQAGYSVDYYDADKVTVDFFRDLPTHDYDLIILRAHSAIPRKDLSLPSDVPQDVLDKIMVQIGDDVLLFTSQPYDSTAYLDDQKALRLFPVVYTGDSMANAYFAVSSFFVKSSMRGRFNGTTIILMGCSSLASDKTAAALVDKGAKGVVGWSDMVSPEHTDQATAQLLQHLLKDKLPLAKAVDMTNSEVGQDPTYGSSMRAYPPNG
ncbi:MAG: hypothetical protein ABSG55_10000 [Dehalococcoidia bacterium]|jgi:hypothetical protein